jgi:hypothetical protein
MRSFGWNTRALVLAGALVGAVACSGLAATPAGAVVPRTASVNYNCKTSFGTLTFPVSVTGTTPKTVAPGAKVSMTGTQVKVTIPAADVNLVMLLGTTASGSAKTLDVNSTDATTTTINAAGTAGIKFGPYKLVKNTALVIALPAKGMTVGTWTAKSKGTMTFTPSSAVLSITISGGKSPTTSTDTCAPAKAATIATTTVS